MSTTTTKKRRTINGYQTMTAAQRYNARMERLFENCKDAQTRFNASSRVELSNPQGDKAMSSKIETKQTFAEGEKVLFQGKVYDFGYLAGRGDYCVLYEEGERNMQDSVSVPLYNVSHAPATTQAEAEVVRPWAERAASRIWQMVNDRGQDALSHVDYAQIIREEFDADFKEALLRA